MTKEFDVDKVQALAAQGLTNEQIALCLEIAESTFYKWKDEKSEFSEAVKSGKAKGIGTITNSLFQSAKGGNITAQIFYLKNRQPDEWRDRREVTGAGGKPIEIAWTVEVIEPDERTS